MVGQNRQRIPTDCIIADNVGFVTPKKQGKHIDLYNESSYRNRSDRELMEMEMEILQGTVQAVVYQNYDNGYAVLRLSVPGNQTVTVVGTIPLPAVGERLMVTGKWSNHSSYGRQFEAEFLERLMPQTCTEIMNYLGSRIIKGIGPRMAARIVEQFREDMEKLLKGEKIQALLPEP